VTAADWHDIPRGHDDGSLPPKSRRNVCAVSRAFGVVVGAAAAEMGQPVDAGAGQLRALVIESRSTERMSASARPSDGDIWLRRDLSASVSCSSSAHAIAFSFEPICRAARTVSAAPV